MTDALFDLAAVVVEPKSCTGDAHEHRWIRFGKHGEREVVVIHFDPAGQVLMSEAAILQLVADAGYDKHDPDAVEIAAARRLAWARSRLQEALDRRGR